MKILYITTIGGTMNFFKSVIRDLLDAGHTVDIATNEKTSQVPDCYREWGCEVYQINTSRSPLQKGNLKAIKQIKKIVADNHYDIVHCHTPVAAMCTRLACRKARKNGTKVFYTAHGFHFYKGAPLKNWLVFYTIEKICSRWTDLLITINKEDYDLAQKKMRAKKIVYVPGVGIDVEKFASAQADRSAKRQEIGVPENAFLLLSGGELSNRKNHQAIIRAMAQLKNPNVHYIIAGKGSLLEKLESLAKELGVDKQFHPLGHRRDVAELYKTADLFVFPSFQEGLPVSVMEARAAGLPIICSNIRGSVELVSEKNRFDPQNFTQIADFISAIMEGTATAECDEAELPLESLDRQYINSMMVAFYCNQ